MSAGKTDCPATVSCPLRTWLGLCPWPCSSLSDDAGPAGAPARLRGADRGAMGEAAGAVAEGGAEGHGAQWELVEVPLPPLLLNLQLYLAPEISHYPKREEQKGPGAQSPAHHPSPPPGLCMSPVTLAQRSCLPLSCWPPRLTDSSLMSSRNWEPSPLGMNHPQSHYCVGKKGLAVVLKTPEF